MKTTSTLERKTALRIVKALNLVMMTMSFAFIWYTFYAKNTDLLFIIKKLACDCNLYDRLFHVWSRI